MAVAQLAARRSHNPKVVSSILTCHIDLQETEDLFVMSTSPGVLYNTRDEYH